MTKTKWNEKGITMLKGLPASGKSTYANDVAQRYENVKRVNKDSLRAMLDGGKYTKPNEKTVLEVRDAMVNWFLYRNKHVIVDDTNLELKHEKTLKEIAQEHKAPFYIKEFDVPLHECIDRNYNRSDAVPTEVILNMYNRHFGNQGRQPVQTKMHEAPTEDFERAVYFICDLDGTLATHEGIRGHHEYAKVGEDAVNEPVAILVHSLIESCFYPIFVSGRPDTCFDATKKWIKEVARVDNPILFMRREGDYRADNIVKLEIWEDHIAPEFDVVFAIDDRTRVVEMWRNHVGLPCFQVNWGDF